VAHPHTHITSHDEARALAIMVLFDDYFANFCESDNNGGYYVYEQDATDFTDFVRFKLGIDDYDGVNIDEVLK
jgi:DNA-binding transcriptional regulator WhiA